MADPQNLASLYEGAIYRVELPTGPAALVVGRRSPLVERWLEENEFARGAYLTAANPGSVPLDDLENAARNERLRRRAEGAGFAFLAAESVGSGGEWPERGLLLLGIAEADALRLAQEFGQAAILAIECGRPVRLSWTGEDPPRHS